MCSLSSECETVMDSNTFHLNKEDGVPWDMKACLLSLPLESPVNAPTAYVIANLSIPKATTPLCLVQAVDLTH